MESNHWKRWTLVLWSVVCCYGGTAAADNAAKFATVQAVAGQRHVVIPLLVTNDAPLTLLNTEVSFDPALCGMIERSTLQRVGRAIVDPLEGGIGCPGKAKLSIALLDLMGGAAVPAGNGAVVEWTFDVRPEATGGVFPLSLSITQASNGPVSVPLSVQNGEVVIVRSVTPPVGGCPGDCNGDGSVSIDELIVAVNIGLGTASVAQCPSLDLVKAELSVAELVEAVNSALAGCSAR